jgi:hypothetical protein
MGLDSDNDVHMTVHGERHFVRRKLLTDKLFTSQCEISVVNESGSLLASALLPHKNWTVPIVELGRSYELVRERMFVFRIRLDQNGREILRIKDTTPFLTFTSRREFEIEADDSISPLLLSFTFLMTHNWYF